MPGNSIRNTPKHRNRHLQDRSTYLQISKCNLFLIPSSCTPPRCGEGSLSRGGQKLAAHPRSGSPLCVPPPAGQVGALMGGCPCAVPCTPRPTTGEKAPCPRGMADPLWGKVCARNLFGILCLLINFADGCLPLWSDQRGAKALLGAPPPPSPRHTQGLLPLSHSISCGYRGLSFCQGPATSPPSRSLSRSLRQSISSYHWEDRGRLNTKVPRVIQ